MNLTAEVIARDSNWFNVILIDKGKHDIKRIWLITDNGLVVHHYWLLLTIQSILI